jgi:hypothetical protein
MNKNFECKRYFIAANQGQKFTLTELLGRHVDKSKTYKMILDVFPPDKFEYQEIEELKLKNEVGDELIDIESEVCYINCLYP